MDYLRRIPDVRRKQGIRYNLDALLTIFILSIMSGRCKYREIERFAKQHEEFFTELLGLKHGVPSNVSIREVIRTLDWQALQTQCNAWALASLPETDNNDILARVLCFDGKALRATLSDYESAYQDFVCFLHGFVAATGIIVHAQEYQNGHKSELQVMQDVIQSLTVRGYIITIDALHCQKKLSASS